MRQIETNLLYNCKRLDLTVNGSGLTSEFFNCINNCKTEDTGSSLHGNSSSFSDKCSNILASYEWFNFSFNAKACFCISKNGSAF